MLPRYWWVPLWVKKTHKKQHFGMRAKNMGLTLNRLHALCSIARDHPHHTNLLVWGRKCHPITAWSSSRFYHHQPAKCVLLLQTPQTPSLTDPSLGLPLSMISPPISLKIPPEKLCGPNVSTHDYYIFFPALFPNPLHLRL